MSTSRTADSGAVDLYWMPLGAGDGTGCVRWNGRIFEAMRRATSTAARSTCITPRWRCLSTATDS